MKPGIFKDLPMSEYIADKLGDVPTLNAGACHDLLTRSPLHCWTNHPRLNPNYQPESNERADIGSAAHELLIGGESRIVEIPFEDYRKSDAKAAREAAWAEGKTPVLYTKLAGVRRMVEVACEYLRGSELSTAAQPFACENTMVWQAGESWCRARPDWLTADRRLHISYKTTAGSAEPGAWIRSHLALDGYDVSLAFYERGLSMFQQSKRELRSIFLIQEQQAPYACSLVGLDPAMQDLASRKVNRAINLWADCLAKDRWPGYPRHIAYAEPAAWMMQQEDERELRNFELGGQA
jgi:hypothetical protein